MQEFTLKKLATITKMNILIYLWSSFIYSKVLLIAIPCQVPLHKTANSVYCTIISRIWMRKKNFVNERKHFESR